MKTPEEWLNEVEFTIGIRSGILREEFRRVISRIQQDALADKQVNLVAKVGWQIEVQKELGFKDKYKLYIHDENGMTLVRVCKLDDEQFELKALLG